MIIDEGKVYGCGSNSDHCLRLSSTHGNFDDFTMILGFSKEINSVFAGSYISFFLTKEGKAFVSGSYYKLTGLPDYEAYHCGDNAQYESKFKKNVFYCIPEMSGVVILKGFRPEMSPNTNVKNEIKIGLFGSEGKIKIANIFSHNIFDDDDNDNNNNDCNEYVANIEIDHAKIKLLLIDSSKYENDSNLKLNAIRRKFKCEVFEVYSNDIKTFNKPIYSFFESSNKHNGIIKTNQERINPFLKEEITE